MISHFSGLRMNEWICICKLIKITNSTYTVLSITTCWILITSSFF
jgi:hypothetical protein